MEQEETHPLIKFFQMHGRWLLTAVMLLTAGTAITYRIVTSRQAGRINDFFQAEIELKQISTNEADAAEALARLIGILDRHSELHQKYDGALAHNLIKQDEVALGETYAAQVLGRCPASVHDYADFSETSILISREEYGSALDRALALQERLQEQESTQYGGVLRIQNLLRIAFLYQEVGTATQERLAWVALIKALETSDNQTAFDTAARDQVLTTYRDGRLTLVDYAKDRLAVLADQ